MGHFAVIDKQTNTVIQVIRVDNSKLLDEKGEEQEELGIAHLMRMFPKETPWGPIDEVYFKQTSYNADGTDKKWYNFAGIGHTYEPLSNAFIAPVPKDNPKIDTTKMTELEKIALGNKTTLEGSWELDEKMRWTFKTDIIKEPGIIEKLLGRMFSPTAEPQGDDSSIIETIKTISEHETSSEITETVITNDSWWKKFKSWLGKAFKF